MTKNKKAWMEPELIVLVRSKPEEAVLTACKSVGLDANYYIGAGGCHYYSCEACSSLGGS